MRRSTSRLLAAVGILVTAVCVILVLSYASETDLPLLSFGTIAFQEEIPMLAASNTIAFVGDVMLARDVENKITAYGAGYPFQYMQPLLREHLYVLGNFESSMRTPHIQTESMTMTFSTASSSVRGLGDAGFTHMSLANNHSNDYGTEGVRTTARTLRAHDLVVFGQQYDVSSSSLMYLDTPDGVIGILGVNLIYQNPDYAHTQRLLRELTQLSDVQIAYVHWGEEYQLRANQAQRAFAEFLVENGIDSIVGHHPHVVQNIERIDGVPVFYSLGNFVFDQYFNDDVQQGLLLTLEYKAEEFVYRLTPVSSIGSRTSPRPMPAHERDAFLAGLAQRSSKTLSDQIRMGELVISVQ